VIFYCIVFNFHTQTYTQYCQFVCCNEVMHIKMFSYMYLWQILLCITTTTTIALSFVQSSDYFRMCDSDSKMGWKICRSENCGMTEGSVLCLIFLLIVSVIHRHGLVARKDC